jgi:cell division protease FtsH
MRRVLRSPITYVAVALVLAAILLIGLQGGSSRTHLATGTFEQDLAVPGRVVSATIHDDSNEVTGRLADGTSYVAEYPARYSVQITDKVAAAVPAFETDHSHANPWLGVLVDYLPFLLLFGAGLYLLSSMQGGGGRIMAFGKSRARAASKDQQSLTFADVAGADEAVAELQEIKEFLESPGRFQALGAKIPKGVLLFGPPGTGKTLLARAVAGEAGVPFFSISGSDFVEMFVGVGASRVRDLFEQAKANAPAIVFMDEIDAVGRQRGAGLGGGNDEREQTLNQLLVEMDGFDTRGGIILIAATNRPDVLDPALLRPGRFDRQIAVDRPDRNGRRRILEVHAQNKPLHPGVSLDVLAQRTPGFTGADLANLLNEAALLTARRNLRQIGSRECEEAIDRVLAGPERKALVMSDHDKLVTAYHEAGHVIVGHVLPDADPIHKVSIVARSRSLGLTFTLPEDRFNHSRSQLRDAMAMCLGGRTAEELVFDEPTTGAENDIDKASGIARAMVTEYGMSDVLGPRQLGQAAGEVFLGRELGHQVQYSQQTAGTIDQEIQMLIEEAHQRARDILTEHRSTLDVLARELVERETLDSPELMAIIGELGSWSAPAPRPGPVVPVGVEPSARPSGPPRRPLVAARPAAARKAATPKVTAPKAPKVPAKVVARRAATPKVADSPGTSRRPRPEATGR